MSVGVAGVCILDNPYSIDREYDYRIPYDLEADVRPGVFVKVPFGFQNRHRIALVCSVRQKSNYRDLKIVISVCPSKLSLDGEFLGLCAFMKERVLCTTGDAVRSMIPGTAIAKLVQMYRLSEQGTTEPSAHHREDDQRVVDFLMQKKACSRETLCDKFGILAYTCLRRLISAGVVEEWTELRDQPREPVERLWVSRRSSDELLDLADGRWVDGMHVSSQKQQSILRLMAENHEPMSRDRICEPLGISTEGPLRTLCEKGILETVTRKIDRNPYKNMPYRGQTPLSLNEEQTAAVQTLSSLADHPEAKAALLHGVTGSGKTVVMTALIDHVLSRGKGVILLLPEIALTPQTVSIFCARYGNRVAVIHSMLSAGERYDTYFRIKNREADVVIGTRSAVFAPIPNLGAVIIDEEHEHTYKSDQNPRYHARDIARFRCAHHKALMLLASATPSLESYKKALEGTYTLVELNTRFGGATLPRVEIADMRREAKEGSLSPIGRLLASELCRVTDANEQAILFLNRRGYNHSVTCRTCGDAVTCPSCSVSMTYHTRRGTYSAGDLLCHWCGKRIPMPETCPSCGSPHLARMGYGTQRVEEELGSLLPGRTVMRMDTDTTSEKFAYDRMLTEFREHRADVLLGTQMVTKGHDFPDVTLVGVLLADTSLYLDDYRAAERTFSMITQVIGRAGRRGEKKGLAVIQTSNPDHEVISLACRQDYKSFYAREIELRRLLVFPPFCDIALITFTGVEEGEMALRHIPAFMDEFKRLRKEQYPDLPMVVFGPFEAPVYRVDNKFRMRLVIKCKANRPMLALLRDVSRTFTAHVQNVSLSVDINPSNL